MKSEHVRQLLELLAEGDDGKGPAFDCEKVPLDDECGTCWQCRCNAVLECVEAAIADEDTAIAAASAVAGDADVKTCNACGQVVIVAEAAPGDAHLAGES